MTELSLHINFDSNVTVSDIIGQNTLDVAVLKKDAPDARERQFVNEAEAVDARDYELEAIDTFIAQNGVTRPTAEDFIPKSQAWRSKKSAAAAAARNPNAIDRRGRPRISYVKDLTFVVVGKDAFKRAGRGRAKQDERREIFSIHHTNIDATCEGTHTRKALVALARTQS